MDLLPLGRRVGLRAATLATITLLVVASAAYAASGHMKMSVSPKTPKVDREFSITFTGGFSGTTETALYWWWTPSTSACEPTGAAEADAHGPQAGYYNIKKSPFVERAEERAGSPATLKICAYLYPYAESVADKPLARASLTFKTVS